MAQSNQYGIPLALLLRPGIIEQDMPLRARRFADSAQCADGAAAPLAWRRCLHAALQAFLAALGKGLVAQAQPARMVTVFGTFRYHIDATRSNVDLLHLPRRRWIADFDAGSPMRTFAWTDQMDLGDALLEVDASLVRWLRQRVQRFARRHVDGIALRCHLGRLLDLDAAALLRARRAKSALPSRGDCSSTWLRGCNAQAEALDEVWRVAPTVFPLVGQVPHLFFFPRDASLLQHLRITCRRAGITPADWSRLLATPPRPVWENLRRKTFAPAVSPADLLAAWCRVHRGLPDTQKLSSSMWHILVRPNGEAVGDALHLPEHWPASPKLIQSILDASIAARKAHRHEAFLAQLAEVIRWRADFTKRGYSTTAMTFAGALRRARAEARRLRAETHTTPFPPFPLSRWTDGVLEAVDLSSPRDVVEEAITQAHCADGLIPRIANGELRLFSVRHKVTGKRIGTVSLMPHEGGWWPENAKHFANEPPNRMLVTFVFQLAKACSGASGHCIAPTPRAMRAFLASAPGGLKAADAGKSPV